MIRRLAERLLVRTGALAPLALCFALGLACGPSAPERGAPASSATPPPGLGYVPPAPGSYALPPIQRATDGDVVDATGAKRRLFDYMGDRYAVLSFVYTRCGDVGGCPMATAVLHELHAAMADDPELKGRVRLVTLSFDPGHDTPDVMEHYARIGGVETDPAEGSWVFLTTRSPVELAPILEGYGQYVVPERGERGAFEGRFTHVLKVFLVDPSLRVRNIYSTSFLHPALVISDLKTLLREEAAATG